MRNIGKYAGFILLTSLILLIALGIIFYKESNLDLVVVDEPVFSNQGGMYKENITLTISSKDGTEVYYTLDGSEPDSNSQKYTEPIVITNATSNPNKLSDMGPELISTSGTYSKPRYNVDKGTVIRAVAIDEAGNVSDVVTETFFVNIDNERYGNLPIVSLVTNPYNLFDYYSGIYILGNTYGVFAEQNPNVSPDGSTPANYNRRGREWERVANLEYFDTDGSKKVSQKIGIRIQGAFSRSNIQKSFSIYAREEYGKSTIDCNFFGEDDNTSYERLVLKTIEDTKYVDPYVMINAQGLNVDAVKNYQPVIVFLDGEYWGIYTMTEPVSVEYIADEYNINPHDMLEVKADGYGNYNVEVGRKRDIGYFNKMINYAKDNDLSIDENYKKISELMDTSSFADWVSLEIYLGNRDCIKPDNFDNNVKIWRTMASDNTTPQKDGRWRWIFFDIDKGVGYKDDYTFNDMEERLLKNNEKSVMQQLFRSLMVNDEFRQMFEESFRNLGETVYNQYKVPVNWNQFGVAYVNQFNMFYARFPSTWQTLEKGIKRFQSANDYFINRPLYVETMINSLEQYVSNEKSSRGGLNE